MKLALVQLEVVDSHAEAVTRGLAALDEAADAGPRGDDEYPSGRYGGDDDKYPDYGYGDHQSMSQGDDGFTLLCSPQQASSEKASISDFGSNDDFVTFGDCRSP